MQSDEAVIEVLPGVEGELVERISKADLKPLFEADHDHEYQRDPSDETDDFFAETCTKCPVGRLVRKR